MPTSVLKDEDDDEVHELKERLAAYNLESSPDRSAGNFILPTVMVSSYHYPEG